VELRVGSSIRGLDGLKTFGGNYLEGCVCFVELPLLNTGQRQKAERKRLLRRYLPNRKVSSRLFDLESGVKVFRNSSPCLKAGVSSRCLYDLSHLR